MHGCSNLVAGWQCIQHDARVRLERGCSVIPGRFTTLAAMFFGVLTIFTSSFIVSDVEHSVHNQKLSRRYRPVNDVILVHYCNTTWYGVERDDISVQCCLYSQVQDVTTVWYYLFTSCTIIRLHIAPIC